MLGTEEHELAAIGLWLPPNTDITVMKMFKFGFGKLPLDIGTLTHGTREKFMVDWVRLRSSDMTLLHNLR